MYLIVGLGNPEPDYSRTRHNMGFDAVNMLSEKYNINVTKSGFDGLYGLGEIEKQKVILLKPQTYMNESGISIEKIVNYYKIKSEDIIVIYDDIDLDVGKVKIRKKGGAGTHNGMKSIISHLQTENFTHIRIGTGMPEFKELLIPYVLQKLNNDQYNELVPAIQKAVEAIEEVITNNVDSAMNKYN